MRLQKAVLINQQATKHDVDQWMEDLLIRIQLRITHPHNVIDQEGSPIARDARVLQLGGINVNKLLLDEFTLPNTPEGGPRRASPTAPPIMRSHPRMAEAPKRRIRQSRDRSEQRNASAF